MAAGLPPDFPGSLAGLMAGKGPAMSAGAPASASGPGPDGDALPDGDKVDQAIVVYMTSDQGPFACQNCKYFDQPSACDIVQGPIDPQGCCDLFTKGSSSEPGQDENHLPA